MKTLRIATALLGVAIALTGPSAVRAAEEHQPAAPGAHEHEEGDAPIPATAAAIWHEVQEHQEQLGKVIAAKELDDVHEVAFEIRDLVNALPDKSKDLPAEKLAKVKANAKFVASLAQRLDASGDAGDQAATEANFEKLGGILKAIAAQYPPDALKYLEGELEEGEEEGEHQEREHGEAEHEEGEHEEAEHGDD